MDTEMGHEAFSNLTDIQNFFYGQNVFLTGVTGLVGKVILEKLLRSCPGIGMVYIHMRHKKGLTPQQRMDKLFKLELFREVKNVFPLFRKKVQVIEGDITENRLGISFEDFEKLKQNVNIVIHSAASVQFNDPLRIAVQSNLIASKRVMDLCHEMPHIKAVVHVSTAYVKREEDGSVLEEIPKMKVTPKQLLDALEWMDDKAVDAVQEYLLEKKLTTYLITKALAEMAIEESRGDLPVALVRPCYISPTFQDPFPGWIDALQGISGLLLAGAKGVLRTLRAEKGVRLNLIPVDIVSNTVIASAWHVGTTKPAPLFIINCVMDYDQLPIADQDILDFALSKRDEYPLVNIFRYPDFKIYYNDFGYKLHALIDQWIPALILDFFLYIFTGKIILWKVYNKIDFLYKIFFRLGTIPWICRLENKKALMARMSEEDAQVFHINTDNFDWPSYLENCLKGGRIHLAREDPSNIPYAKKKAMTWWTVTTIMKWCLIFYILYRLFYCFYPVQNTFEERFYTTHS